MTGLKLSFTQWLPWLGATVVAAVTMVVSAYAIFPTNREFQKLEKRVVDNESIRYDVLELKLNQKFLMEHQGHRWQEVDRSKSK